MVISVNELAVHRSGHVIACHSLGVGVRTVDLGSETPFIIGGDFDSLPQPRLPMPGIVFVRLVGLYSGASVSGKLRTDSDDYGFVQERALSDACNLPPETAQFFEGMDEIDTARWLMRAAMGYAHAFVELNLEPIGELGRLLYARRVLTEGEIRRVLAPYSLPFPSLLPWNEQGKDIHPVR